MGTASQRAIAVSGLPPEGPSCGSCLRRVQATDLTTAGRHRRLRGTQWLRDARLGKLRVCRRCDRLWSEHFDSRERYTWYRDLGWGTLDILAQDSTPEAIVAWAATQAPESACFWVREVLAVGVRRHPEWSGPAMDAVLDALTAPVVSPSELAAHRRAALLDMAGSVVARAVDPGPGGRVENTDAHGARMRRLCAAHRPDPRDDRVHRGKNSSVIARMAREQAWITPGPETDAPIRVADFMPLVAMLDSRPLNGEPIGSARGMRQRQAFETLERLQDHCRRPASMPPVAAPLAAWQGLQAGIDPVGLLANHGADLLGALSGPPQARLEAIFQAREFLPILADRGARFGRAQLARLVAVEGELRDSRNHQDAMAASALAGIIRTFEHWRDFDCTAVSGDCAPD